MDGVQYDRKMRIDIQLVSSIYWVCLTIGYPNFDGLSEFIRHEHSYQHCRFGDISYCRTHYCVFGNRGGYIIAAGVVGGQPVSPDVNESGISGTVRIHPDRIR